jgi:tRNA-(ms[2]io[6]A)-hydroxylase
MLRLARPTAPDWAQRVLPDLDEVLVVHAHLEKKAASTALNLMFRYPDDQGLMQPLSELAREELRHFEAVLAWLDQRGVAFRPLVPSAYAKELHKGVRRSEPHRLLDTLLCCALIESRSCERMKLLAEALPEGALKDFYRSLLESEAHHHALYVDLAIERFGKADALARLAELAAHESDVIEGLPREARLHSQ